MLHCGHFSKLIIPGYCSRVFCWSLEPVCFHHFYVDTHFSLTSLLRKPLLFPAGVVFTKHPSNQTVSQGKEVRLGCAVEGVAEPDIMWIKDGEKLYSTDQVFLMLGEQHWETSHRSSNTHH